MLDAGNLAWSNFSLLSHGVIEALKQHGEDWQRQAFLRPLIEGRWTGTMCLTEPHCGTDLGMLRTKAVPNGDGAYKIFAAIGVLGVRPAQPRRLLVPEQLHLLETFASQAALALERGIAVAGMHYTAMAAAQFAVFETAGEMAVSLVLIGLHREPWGTARARCCRAPGG